MKRPIRWIASITTVAFIGTSGGFGPWFPSAFAKTKRRVTPTVALVGFRTGDSDIEGRARKRLQADLKGTRRLLVTSEKSTAKVVKEVSQEDAQEAATTIRRAYKNYQNGKKLYQRLALQEAIKALNASVRGYREGIAVLRDNRDLLMSHLYLGMALIILGRETEGRKFIREMVILDPNRKEQKLSPRDFSPKILNIHRILTDEVRRGPSGKLVVKTDPPGATIVFDGVVQKASPFKASDVPVGEHFMVVEKKGYRSHSRRIVIGAGENRINAKLKEWNPFAPYLTSRRKELTSLKLLGRVADQLSSQILLLGEATKISRSKVEVRGQLFDARAREFSKVERITTSPGRVSKASSDLAKKLMQSVTRGGFVLAEVTAPTLPLKTQRMPVATTTSSSKEKGGLMQKWWFWAAVGVVVAGTVGGIVLATRKSPNYNVLNVPNPIAP